MHDLHKEPEALDNKHIICLH